MIYILLGLIIAGQAGIAWMIWKIGKRSVMNQKLISINQNTLLNTIISLAEDGPIDFEPSGELEELLNEIDEESDSLEDKLYVAKKKDDVH